MNPKTKGVPMKDAVQIDAKTTEAMTLSILVIFYLVVSLMFQRITRFWILWPWWLAEFVVIFIREIIKAKRG